MGRRSALVRHPRGHRTRPPSEEELQGKFEELTGRPALFDRLRGLSTLDDTRLLIRELASGTKP